MSLPVGTTLLYVDPDNASAAGVRAALRSARSGAADLGVLYRDDEIQPTPEPGTRLVIDARAVFADIDPTALRTALDQLDATRVHALIAVRGPARSLALEWQAMVTRGLTDTFDAWLTPAAQPWVAERQRGVVARWAEVLGPSGVTVVVPCADDVLLLRTIEELAGLDAGTLPDRAERPLTLGEAEAIRALNLALAAHAGPGRVDRGRLGSSARARMIGRDPGEDEPAITLPPWAREQIRGQVSDLAETINAAGTSVIGRLDCLSDEATGRTGDAAPVTDVPSEAAALLAAGIVDALGLGRKGRAKPYIETREFGDLSTFRLIAAIAARPAHVLRATLPIGRPRGSGRRGFDGHGLASLDARAGNGDVGRPDRIASPTMMLPLPQGTRLIHIGPSKTGTTALQASFDRAREAALRQGLRYVGWRRHARAAVLQATGRSSKHPVRATREWRDIVTELRTASEPRTIFSSEGLSTADSAFIRRFIEDLDHAKVHVAVTLRPLAKILPSVWQEVIKFGSDRPFDSWLRTVLLEPDAAPGLWHRHRHDALIDRWVAVIGPERVTAIVVDDRDRSSLPRAFESLLDLPAGTLRLHRDLSNRSLTRGEIEAVRALNTLLGQDGHGRDFRRVVVGLGASYWMRLRDPDPAEPRIPLPPWADEPVSRIAHDIVRGIAASGVHVIGDLGRLTATSPESTADSERSVGVPPAAAAAMAMGVLEAAGLVHSRQSGVANAERGEARDWVGAKLASTPARELTRVVAVRARRAARAAHRGARRLLRSLSESYVPGIWSGRRP